MPHIVQVGETEAATGIMEADSGVVSLTQFGVEFPNGVVHWGDVAKGSRVNLKHMDLVVDGYNQQSVFYLDAKYAHRSGSSAERNALQKRWRETQERMQMGETNLVDLRFVERELVIVRGMTRTS